MAKFVILAVIVYLAYSAIKQRAPEKNEKKHEEDMVQCDHCGIYHLKRESLEAGGRHFCCEAHRRLHRDE